MHYPETSASADVASAPCSWCLCFQERQSASACSSEFAVGSALASVKRSPDTAVTPGQNTLTRWASREELPNLTAQSLAAFAFRTREGADQVDDRHPIGVRAGGQPTSISPAEKCRASSFSARNSLTSSSAARSSGDEPTPKQSTTEPAGTPNGPCHLPLSFSRCCRSHRPALTSSSTAPRSCRGCSLRPLLFRAATTSTITRRILRC